MKKIQGHLSLMPLQEIMKWVESCSKTGVLRIREGDTEKKIYFQEGKVIFLTSNRDGERVGEFLAKSRHLDLTQVRSAIEESRNQGVPFTGYLLSQKLMDRATLETVIHGLVAKAVAHALCWRKGIFEFIGVLPPAIMNGPIKLDAAGVLDEALQSQKVMEPGSEQSRELIKAITQRLVAGSYDLPPMPDIIQKLSECMGDDGASAHEVMKILMADQILTAKILKFVNSAFYGLANPVTSLQYAIVYVGFATIKSIVTAHSLSRIFVKNTEEIREILRQSLMCAYVAKKLGAATGFDEEEAFVCGLLHDVGKTAMLNLLADYDLTEAEKTRLVDQYHPKAGSVLAIQWKLPELVQKAIKYHHTPENAPSDQAAVEIVFFTRGLLEAPESVDTLVARCTHLDFSRVDIGSLLEGLDEIRKTAGGLI